MHLYRKQRCEASLPTPRLGRYDDGCPAENATKNHCMEKWLGPHVFEVNCNSVSYRRVRPVSDSGNQTIDITSSSFLISDTSEAALFVSRSSSPALYRIGRTRRETRIQNEISRPATLYQNDDKHGSHHAKRCTSKRLAIRGQMNRFSCDLLHFGLGR